MNKVSKSIKKYRLKAGLTQNGLAEKLFVSRQTVSSWENGRTQPDIDSLTQLSGALSVSVEELIYGEKPRLVENGQNEKTRKTIMTVFAVLASLLVGVGGVLVFVSYWNEFPDSMKAVFSVLPMLIGQAAAIFVFFRKSEITQWREGASVLWCAGVAATVALCDGVLELSLNFRSCALVDVLLFLPVIYILDAVAPLIACYGLSVYLGVASADDMNSYLLSFGIMLLLLAAGAVYVFIHRRETEDPRHIYSVWITVLAFTAFSVWTGIMCEEQFFTVFIALMTLLYALRGKGSLFAPAGILAPIALAVVSVILTVSLRPNEYADEYDALGYQSIIIIALSVLAFIAALIMIFREKPGGADTAYTVSLIAVFLIALLCVRTRFEGELMTYIAVFIVVMAQGISSVVAGAKENRFLPLNIGLLTVISLIMEIVISQDIDTLISGFIMILFGVCLFVINFRLAKKAKISSEGAVENE